MTSLFATLVGVLGLLVVVNAPAASAASGDFSIKMYDHAWCIEVPNGSTANGVALYTASCTAAANQRWTFTPDSTGTWGEYRNVATGKCMDVRGGSHSYDAVIQQYACNGGNSQKFWQQNAFLRTRMDRMARMCVTATNIYAPTDLRQWGCGTVPYNTAWIAVP
ncbi:RICIN domain-containing protein [Actinosynnema sp. NPDC059797]